MKRLFAILATALIVATTTPHAQAQERGDWQANVSVGALSLPDYIGLILVAFGSIDTTEGVSSHSFIPLTNLNAELNYSFNHWFQLGATLSLGYASAGSTFDDTGNISRDITAFYPSLCVNATTRYMRKGNFTLYGSYGLGVMGIIGSQYDSDTANKNVIGGVAPMGNIYPIAMKFGDKKGFFAELGWGAKGIVNLGGFINF